MKYKYKSIEIIKTANGWVIKPNDYYYKEGIFIDIQEWFSFDTDTAVVDWLSKNLSAAIID